MTVPDKENPLESLLEEAEKSADENEEVTLGNILDSFGSRSFGPLISFFALIAIIPPISGIPFVPTSMGALIILLSIQLVFGRKSPWVPSGLKGVGISDKKIKKARDRAGKWLVKIDKLITERLTYFSGEVGQRISAACCSILACLLPPLEIVPFAAALPASTILVFGIGLTARDGVLILIGFLMTGAALFFGYGWIFG